VSGSPIAGQLKIWPGDLDEIRLGKKKAEIRRCDDKHFRQGQVWELIPWDVELGIRLPLESLYIRITHVERMAGPLMVVGIGHRQGSVIIPLAVLSFELATS